jgi:hypothetical protein
VLVKKNACETLANMVECGSIETVIFGPHILFMEGQHVQNGYAFRDAADRQCGQGAAGKDRRQGLREVVQAWTTSRFRDEGLA